MDGDVQQQYLAAEQAYGEGDFDQAEAIASALLRRLDSTTGSGIKQEACLAWRAFVALLLGHIYFHGLHQADKAEVHYQLVLASAPPDTLRDLAQQGVERCKALADQAASSDPPTGDSSTPVDGASIGTAATSTAAAGNGPDNARVESAPTLEHDLIRDPFLGTSCAATASSTPTAAASTFTPSAHGSATPWLQSVAPLQNGGEGMASAASGDPTASSDGATLTNNARVDPDVDSYVEPDVAQKVELKDVNPIAADEAPSPSDELPLDELPTEQTPTALEPLDLSPWLLRRTITFDKR